MFSFLSSVKSEAADGVKKIVPAVTGTGAARPKASGIQGSFKKTFSDAKKRAEESARMLKEHPDYVPVIIERAKSSRDMETMSKHKFLVKSVRTVAEFMMTVRKNLTIDETTAIYLHTTEGSILSSQENMATLYEREKDEDGFLYVVYSKENTFGGST